MFEIQNKNKKKKKKKKETTKTKFNSLNSNGRIFLLFQIDFRKEPYYQNADKFLKLNSG